MKKNLLTQYFWLLFFVTTSVQNEASASFEAGCSKDCGDGSQAATIPIKMDNKNKLLINKIDFWIIQKDKWTDDPFDETNISSSTSLYEFNYKNNKSDINKITFHVLPFFNKKSQDKNKITSLQIDFF